MIGSARQRLELIGQLTIRDIAAKYQGSMLGLIWAALSPLLTVVMYTFLFSYVFQARWGPSEQSHVQYGVIIYAGLIVHACFMDVLNRATACILGHANLVKKVVFPTQIIPVVVVASALFHFLLSLTILVLMLFFTGDGPPLSALVYPLVLLPAVLYLLGLAWGLSALGVYVRDLPQIMPLLGNVLLFAGPVLYPREALPTAMQPWLLLNPITFPVEQSRALLFGQGPLDLAGLTVYVLLAVVCAGAGWTFFIKTRKGFADVL